MLYNYVRAARQFNCDESITYTTHGEFRFLDNLEPLLERWQGPISVAVYAPGSDLQDTIDTILYFRSGFVLTSSAQTLKLHLSKYCFGLCACPLRQPITINTKTFLSNNIICNFRDCSKSSLVRELATFHIILDLDHIPGTVPEHQSLLHQVRTI